MDSKLLQIGDWIYFGKDEYSPSKIDGILPYDEGVVLDFDNEPISNDNIRPIPLTAEILEKNGWVFNDVPFVNGWEFMGLTIIDWRISCGINISMNVRYVHELQHALRLCGLTELADNLII